MAILAISLDYRFEDTFSKATASYANTFGLEHVTGSIYETLYLLDPVF